MNKKRFGRNGNVFSGDPDPGPVDPPPPDPDEMLKGEKKSIAKIHRLKSRVLASSMPEKKKFD